MQIKHTVAGFQQLSDGSVFIFQLVCLLAGVYFDGFDG